jgi:hypothetical protein
LAENDDKDFVKLASYALTLVQTQLSRDFYRSPLKNPHSLERCTKGHNSRQLQLQQNKASYNKVFQGLPIRCKLFHVEQFAEPPERPVSRPGFEVRQPGFRLGDMLHVEQFAAVFGPVFLGLAARKSGKK